MRVRLESEEGFKVGEFETPDFITPPHLITYRTRLFRFFCWKGEERHRCPTYKEVIPYNIPFAETIEAKG